MEPGSDSAEPTEAQALPLCATVSPTMWRRSILPFLRKAESFLRRRTRHVTGLATRFNRLVFFALDLVLWSRVFRSQRGPIPVELPLRVLRGKQVEVEAPVLHVSGLHGDVAHWDDGFAGVYAVLFENLQVPDVLSPIRYAHPAPAFRGVYLWDSAFISQIWKTWDRDVAHDVSRVVVHLRDGDRLQHVVSDLVASVYTQPPLIAWSLARLWEGHGREEAALRLEPLFPALCAYNDWLYANRRLANGLFFWRHPYESGVENAPRFSSRDESVFRDTTKLAAPDLSAYVVLQNEALATMARILHRDPEPFLARAADLQGRIREELWHAGDGLFYDRNIDTGEFIRSRTIASILPLWAGAAGEGQLRRLLEHVLSPEGFNSPLPFPSVAISDPDFSLDMWRGPVWVNVAFGALQGLKRYGLEREASEMAYRLCDHVYRMFRRERRFYEFYDPEEAGLARLYRKKGNRWKAFTLGVKPQADFVGWTGLVNTLVIEQFAGFHRENGRRFVQPRFPPAAVGKAYALRLPGENLALDFCVLGPDSVRVTIRTPTQCVEALVAFGERAAIDPPSSNHEIL